MNELSTDTQPARDSEAYQLAEKLLRPRFQILDALAFAASLNPNSKAAAEDHKRTKDEARGELMVLPIHELRNRVQKQEAQAAADQVARAESEKKRKQEKAAREARAAAEREVNKFYNLSSSTADFRHWATMDYWSFDEALALLMGKDPQIMTKEAMRKEIEPEFSLLLLSPSSHPKSNFVRRYEALRTVAERAGDMKPAQLLPLNVLLWAHRSGAIAPPAELVQAVSDRLQRSQPKPVQSAPVAPSEPAKASAPVVLPPPATSTQLKRFALIQKHERAWPSIEADLRHANENGLSESAKANRHGFWLEEPALQWARQNGKLFESRSPSSNLVNSAFASAHRSAD